MIPEADDDVPAFVASLGLPGLVDVHTHFLPDRVMDKVWAYFDAAESHYGRAWPVHYRTSVAERLATLDKLGVLTFAPLVYPHKPGMARWLTEWVLEFAAHTPGAVPTGGVNLPNTPVIPGASNVTWKSAMALRARKVGEPEFPKAKKFGIEVFEDNRTGNLIFISETGSIAVLPKH